MALLSELLLKLLPPYLGLLIHLDVGFSVLPHVVKDVRFLSERHYLRLEVLYLEVFRRYAACYEIAIDGKSRSAGELLSEFFLITSSGLGSLEPGDAIARVLNLEALDRGTAHRCLRLVKHFYFYVALVILFNINIRESD